MHPDIIKLMSGEPVSDQIVLWSFSADAGKTLTLGYICRSGNIRQVQMLLQMGAIPGEFALEMASEHGHVEVVRTLLRAGVNPNNKNAKDFAKKKGHFAVIDLLENSNPGRLRRRGPQ